MFDAATPEDSRPVKRTRVDSTRIPDRFDFVSQPAYGSNAPPQSTAEANTRKAHGKKQPLSCAECRRLKLKCDRSFPCSSCQKRGCAQICPHGALTSGKGSRFILANTEELHAKIAEMSERIQTLEEALASLQASVSKDPHPLLQQHLLRVKSSAELHRAQGADAKSSSGTSDDPLESEISRGGMPNLFDYSMAEQSYFAPKDPQHADQSHGDDHGSTHPSLPPEMLAMSVSFPVPWNIDISIRRRIREMLPSRDDATYLCDQARRNALWQYNLDPSETFIPNLIHHIYTNPIEDIKSRRLGLLLMIMAIGLQVDVKQVVDSPRAECYHTLARVIICESPIMEHPDLDLMQCLFYMMWYLILWSDKDNAAIYSWTVMGMSAKLAQALGLHRADGSWKLIPEESEKRRHLIWELVTLDARLALSLNRPPSFNPAHLECKRPHYEPGPYSYLRYKHDFLEYCISPVLETVVSAKPTPYHHILALDCRIRDFSIPPELDMFGPGGLTTERPRMMQQALVAAGHEILILQLHRTRFTQALSGPEKYTDRHPYAPSVVATFTSACRLIEMLTTFMNTAPALCKRVFGFWFNMFSGVIAIALYVSRAPYTSDAPTALQQMKTAHKLFAHVAEANPRAARAHCLLRKLMDKVTKIVSDYHESARYTGGGLHESHSHFGRSQPTTSDARSHMEPNREVDPFEHAHSFLRAYPRMSHWHPKGLGESALIHARMGLTADDEEIRAVSFTSPTPKANTRVGNQDLNFDFGALTLGPDDSSLMTWF